MNWSPFIALGTLLLVKDGSCCAHGTCTGNYILSCIWCHCYEGYTGSNCETDINECASNPCQNGVCMDHVNKYTCACFHGYGGTNCEIDLNECSSNPCPHFGICHDGVNMYTCSCFPGYTGSHCNSEINLCASNPCKNGGSCINYPTHYSCDCVVGYSGQQCQIGSSISVAPNIILDADKTIPEGSDIEMIACLAEGIPAPTIKWEFVDNQFPRNVKQLDRYLVLENVTINDSGYYMCTASNSAGTDIKAVHITVTAKPKEHHVAPVITAPSIVEVKYYTDASLKCDTTGYPTPLVTWNFRDDTTGTTGDTLIIHTVTNDSVGLYECIATNDADTSIARILLKGTYDASKIIYPPSPIVCLAGQSHNFTCNVTGHPIPQITWAFSSFSAHSNQMPPHVVFEGGTVIRIVNMQESGVLTCTARNEFGVDKATALIVIKHISPAVVG